MKPRKLTVLALVFSALSYAPSHADTAKNSQATEIHTLLHATGVISQFKVLNDLVIQASQANAARCGLSIQNAAIPSFSPDSIIHDTHRSFDQIPNSEIATLIEWFQSPLAIKIHKAEQSNLDGEASARYQASLAKMKNRVDAVKRIVNNTRTNEFIALIGSEVEYAGLLHSGCIAKAQRSTPAGATNVEQATADVTRGDTLAATLLAGSIIADLSYLLRDLTDAELLQYAAFTETTAGSNLYKNLVNAVDKSVKMASDRIKYNEVHSSLDF